MHANTDLGRRQLPPGDLLEPQHVGRSPFPAANRLHPPTPCAKEGGVPDRTRTCDPRFRKPMLYPAELRGHCLIFQLDTRRAVCRYKPALLCLCYGGRPFVCQLVAEARYGRPTLFNTTAPARYKAHIQASRSIVATARLPTASSA